MQFRNNDINIDNFNFSVDSIFTVIQKTPGTNVPPTGDAFLLLEGDNFLLLDGTNFLLLG